MKFFALIELMLADPVACAEKYNPITTLPPNNFSRIAVINLNLNS